MYRKVSFMLRRWSQYKENIKKNNENISSDGSWQYVLYMRWNVFDFYSDS